MRLPWRYNLKSIWQRPMRSLLTILGVSLAVFLSVVMLGLTRGLVGSMVATGDARNALVLSKGAEALEFSALDPQALHILGNAPGVTLASPEVYINSLVTLEDSGQPSVPVITRGVHDIAFQIHPQVKLVEGRPPRRGFEIAIGPLVATRLGLSEDRLDMGGRLRFEGQTWTITGIISAPGTIHESEIWAVLEDLMVAAKRVDYSSLVLQAASVDELENLLFDLEIRTDVRTTPSTEVDYYGAEAERLKPLQVVTMMMTVLLVFGGLMAGMNTMYNSVMGRVREMAVLLVTGYQRRAVLAGFMLEGLLLGLTGGVIGCAAGLGVNGMPMKFSMSAFRFDVDGSVIAIGLGLAVIIGIVGTTVPVLRISHTNIAEGLRAN